MKFALLASGKPWLAAVLALGGVALGSSATAQDLTRLGTVKFTVECAAGARQEFNHAMALYHSFVWNEASAAFAHVAETDPTCGMAHWGRAMVMLNNPFVWPNNLPPEKPDAVAKALEEARSAGLASAREEGYVAALEAFVRDRDTLDHRTRMQAFEDAMGQLSADHPQDMEASILHALVTSANFDPADKTYGNQMRAAAILDPLFQANGDHPGLAHYLIHTYDYPSLAEHGLEAASRYAHIAPDAPHALHMPSHIFTRVGHWEDSIATNMASAKADGGKSVGTHHAYDYMVYAHLQLAHDQSARKAIEQARGASQVDHFGTAFAYAAMPARLVLERGDWEEAAKLPIDPPLEVYPWQKYPQAESINAFARGVGAARSGDAAVAAREQKRLEALREATGSGYWAEQVDIQREIVGALAQCAEGQTQDCIDGLKRAAGREDATEKHAVTPGPILPARELLADVLLENDRFVEALGEYEAVLAKEPNRFRAIAGAMEAADRAGDAKRASTHAAHLLKQAAGADSERAALQLAERIGAE